MFEPATFRRRFQTPLDLVVDAEQRGAIAPQHLALLGHLANWSLSPAPPDLFRSPEFYGYLVPLHRVNARALFKKARERIDAGKIPEDWVEQCIAIVEGRASAPAPSHEAC